MTSSAPSARQIERTDHAIGQFDSLAERVWLNTAHQGVLPKAAAEATETAISWKLKPWEMTTARFTAVPAAVRSRLARLLAVPQEEIVLANSCSYGIHLVANGFPWRQGDEALVVRGDFPSTYLPFLGLRQRGVAVRFLEPRGPAVTAEEVAAGIGPRTRMLCTTWVHSLNGHTVDAELVSAACRARGVRFVLNVSQGLGARPLVVTRLPIDAISCAGFKWLCGPYGTGFCWMRSELLAQLEHNQIYWLAYQTADDLSRSAETDLDRDIGGARYDVFGTASFFNYTAWTASLDLVLAMGVDVIAEKDQALVERFISGLDTERFELASPRQGKERSTLIYLSHRQPECNREIHGRLQAGGVDCALRRGWLRFSPHLYNTPTDIDRALEILNSWDTHSR